MKLSHILFGFISRPIEFGLVFLSAIALIGLIIYRLTNTLSKDEKKKLSYGEIALSLLTSGPQILFLFQTTIFFVFMSFLSLFHGGKGRLKDNLLLFYLYVLFIKVLFILLSPFVLTMIRTNLEDRLTNIQDTILSASTILSSTYAAYIVLVRANQWGSWFDGF